MKKLTYGLILLIITFGLSCPAIATDGLPKIVDQADLLTDYQESMLAEKAKTLVDTYSMDVLILTVPSTNRKDAVEFADDYFDYNGYGVGEERSGVLFLLTMDEREWVISTSGECIEALSDEDQALIMEDVSNYLRSGNYYRAFDSFLSGLDPCFDAYRLDSGDIAILVCGALIFGAIVGLITVLVMKAGMKTAVYQRGAQSYITPGTYQIKNQRDIFLYSHVTKIRRSSDSSGRSGGSSTHRSSSGRTHGGSRGRF